jgi:hypothetical protein
MSDITPKAAEVVQTTEHLVVGKDFDQVVTANALAQPTQVRRPWRSTARTVFQALIALATLLPFVLTDVYSSPDAYPAVVVQVLAAAGVITRVMANPRVEEFLRKFLPFLAAAPAPKTEA